MNIPTIKEMLDAACERGGRGDYSMNRKTWQAFKDECYPGRTPPPNDAVHIWIDDKLADGVCRPGLPNTGYRVR